MAREFAKIKAAIWQDDDFRALPVEAQHLYFVVLTDPDLSYCGVADWRPRRMAPKAGGWGLETIYEAGAILTEQKLLIVDEETEEVLVRSFLRHDGIMQHNKLCISATRAFATIGSNNIRGVVVHELKRLEKEFPEWPAWEREQVREVLKRNSISPHEIPTLAPGLAPNLAPGLAPEVGPTPGAGLASALQQQQQQQPTTATTTCVVGDDEAPSVKTKLPADWMPNQAHKQRAQELGLDLMEEAENFRLHAETHNRKAVQWNSAFTMWLKKSTNFQPNKSTQSPRPNRVQQNLAVVEQLWAQENQTDDHRKEIGQ